MELRIDGRAVNARPGMTLLDAIRELNLDEPELSNCPLTAKIAGEVFNLNYVPVRITEKGVERPSIRRAMAASGGEVHLLRYADAAGKEAYTRTAQFVLFLAMKQLWPQARAKMDCTIGSGLYIRVERIPDFSAALLKQKISQLVMEDIPLIRRRITTAEAISRYRNNGQADKARLLQWRKAEWFDEYTSGDYADYFYGEMMPSTGYLKVWDILDVEGGFMFLFPDDQNPDQVAPWQEMPNYFQVFAEGQNWCRLMACETAADLNDLTHSGKIRELIRVNEALHEKRYAQIADMICQRGAKVVMLAGPSSSGKTTSANRLGTQLRVHGRKPILMSLDNYYRNREELTPGPDGILDLEHIDTIDTVLFRRQMAQLLSGETVELPSFNFKTGKREWHGEKLRLYPDSVIIVEGLHGLNPVLLPEELNPNLIFKMYVSPLLPLNLDDHNRIPTSYLRLLRRIVRDYETRGSSVQQTISMWDSVRQGEKRWIFPFQERVDVIFNSSTLYELAVLKKHIFPLLTEVEPEDPAYESVRSIVKILNYILEADVDDEIPPTSLVREFIGGNTFYR